MHLSLNLFMPVICSRHVCTLQLQAVCAFERHPEVLDRPYYCIKHCRRVLCRSMWSSICLCLLEGVML